VKPSVLDRTLKLTVTSVASIGSDHFDYIYDIKETYIYINA